MWVCWIFRSPMNIAQHAFCLLTGVCGLILEIKANFLVNESQHAIFSSHYFIIFIVKKKKISWKLFINENCTLCHFFATNYYCTKLLVHLDLHSRRHSLIVDKLNFWEKTCYAIWIGPLKSHQKSTTKNALTNKTITSSKIVSQNCCIIHLKK